MKNYFCILSTKDYAKDMLESVYEQKSDTMVHMLLQQWYNYQKKLSDDVATHIVELENLAHRLQTLGEKIPNQMIITKILMILSPSFKYFISAWELTQSNERTLTNLISKLIIEETRAETEERAENIAFTANKHQCKKNFKKGNVRSDVCYCHKPEHWIKEYRNRRIYRKERRGIYWSHVCKI